MRRLLAVVFLLPLAALAWGAGADKHNTLTATEAADGWLLLFDGESTYGWRPPNDSKWTVASGMLAPQAGKPGLLVTTAAFTDFELKFEYQTKVNSTAALLFGCDHDGKRPGSAGSVPLTYRGDGWCRTRVVVYGHALAAAEFRTGLSSNGTKYARPQGPSPAAGHLALAGNGIVFRSIKIRPLPDPAKRWWQ